MAEFLISSMVIFVALSGWIWVQRSYARFAARNPQLGPFRGESGCSNCSCGGGQCRKD